MKRTIQCLQEQLQLVTMEAQEDFSLLSTSSRSLQEPTESLQEKISRSASLPPQRQPLFALPSRWLFALQRVQLCGAPGFAPG